MTTDPVLLSREGDIATVTLNRPDRLNAMNLDCWRRIGALAVELGSDDGLRCIVFRGAGGKAFAAGADIPAFAQERHNAAQAAAYGQVVQETMAAVNACRHPTIALIEGVCVGGGLELAASCDIRICGASSRFGVPIGKLGLAMGYGELAGLIRLVGEAKALEILLEGRIYGAEEALSMGLVSRVVADEAVVGEAYASARRVADNAPLVARLHKKFVRRLRDPRPITPDEYAEAFAPMDGEDYRAGVAAFLAKRKPVFAGR